MALALLAAALAVGLAAGQVALQDRSPQRFRQRRKLAQQPSAAALQGQGREASQILSYPHITVRICQKAAPSSSGNLPTCESPFIFLKPQALELPCEVPVPP